MSDLRMSPVFIGGCARSGTTLLGAILGAHADCLCVPESPFKVDVLRRRDWRGMDGRALLQAVLATRRFRLWGLDPAALRPGVADLGSTYAEGLEWLVTRYGEAVGKPSVRRWVDHTPANVRWSATLAELFPDARFVHIVRDGRGVAASILPLDWGPNTIASAAQWWIEAVAHGLGTESWGGAERVVRVRYEDLVTRTEATVRRLCEFLALDFQPAMLRGDGFRVPDYTSRQHALIGQAPQADRASAWERALTARQVEIFEALSRELLRYLGYELRFGLGARRPTRMEKWEFALAELYATKLRNKIRLHRRRARGHLRRAAPP